MSFVELEKAKVWVNKLGVGVIKVSMIGSIVLWSDEHAGSSW